jgi:hypothetical protein
MCAAVVGPRPTVGLVPVSSLIFVVIVAIWAAFLVQHWARRRENAAASPSVDGFSKRMRVLQKRPPLPLSESTTPDPYSSATEPADEGRPATDVKRAVPADASRRRSPFVARRAAERGRVNAATVATVNLTAAQAKPSDRLPVEDHSEHHTDHDTALYAAEVDRMPESARQSGAHGTQRRPGPSSAPVPAPVPLAQRRLRAALLLAAVAWLPVSIVLTLSGRILWVSIPFAVVTIVAVLVWLRAEAQADRLRTSARTSSGRQRGRRRGAPESRAVELHLPVLSTEDTQVIRSTAAAAVGSRVVAVAQESRTVVAHTVATHHVVAEHAVAQHVEPGVFDVQAPVPSEQPVVVAELAEPVEGEWSPVPVPRPTYALKAKAEPRYTDSGIPADVFDTPEFADEAEELDDRARFARRAVSQ